MSDAYATEPINEPPLLPTLLDQAERAFEAGDYLRVRELCDSLASADDGQVSRAAAALRRRTEPDPVQVAVLVACLVLLVVVVFAYVYVF